MTTCQYRFVSDGLQGRSVEDVVEILRGAQADFIFQGWLTERPLFETDPYGFGYDYQHMREYIQAIKAAMPAVKFGGGIQYEFVYPDQMNPYTGAQISRDEAWSTALDPAKWGVQMSRDEIQCMIAQNFGWTADCSLYDPYTEMRAFLPDITNPEYYALLLDLIRIQIDNGADSIWIDGLFGQSYLWEKMIKLRPARGTQAMEQARQEAHAMSMQVIDDIHAYAPGTEVISWKKGVDTSLGTPINNPSNNSIYCEITSGCIPS